MGPESEFFSDYVWLKANFLSNTEDHQEALKVCNKLVANDPWNISYLVLKSLSLAHLIEDKIDFSAIDKNLLLLAKSSDQGLVWKDYDALTVALDEERFMNFGIQQAKKSDSCFLRALEIIY